MQVVQGGQDKDGDGGLEKKVGREGKRGIEAF